MLLCVCNQFVIQLVLRLFLTGRISVGHLFHIVIVKLTWRQMFLRKLQVPAKNWNISMLRKDVYLRKK